MSKKLKDIAAFLEAAGHEDLAADLTTAAWEVSKKSLQDEYNTGQKFAQRLIDREPADKVKQRQNILESQMARLKKEIRNEAKKLLVAHEEMNYAAAEKHHRNMTQGIRGYAQKSGELDVYLLTALD